MNRCIDYHGRTLNITLTPAAEKALSIRNTPLLVEMELCFSFLIRKAVRFYETPEEDAIPVDESLVLNFRPVMTKRCSFEYREPTLTDFPRKHSERYLPHWLHIDYRDGRWHGDFGYAPPT